MNHREALQANYDRYVNTFGEHGGQFSPLLEAVRKRIAQLPDKQGMYPTETVERIANALEPHLPEEAQPYSLRLAESVLDALNGETP